MKPFKTLLVASLLAMTCVSMASASVTIRITGSSAFRAATENAIVNLLDSPTGAYTGGSFAGASQAIIKGNLHTAVSGIPATTAMIFKLSWTGSAGGVQTLVQNLRLANAYLVDGTTTSTVTASANTPNAGPTGGTLASSPTFETGTIPLADFAMSDAFQNSAGFPSTPALIDNQVGVVPFMWVANNGSPLATTATTTVTTTSGSTAATVASATGLAQGNVLSGNANIPVGATIETISGTSITLSSKATGTASGVSTVFTYPGLTNMSPLLAQVVLGTSATPLAQFTGNPADELTFVEAIGRDEDSGTRIDAFAETGFGITSSPQQYQATISGGVVTDLELWPINTVNGTTYPVGHSGEKSGGSLATDMKATGSNSAANNAAWLVAYLGENDANSAITGGAHAMTYNGVSFSHRAIQEGRYTFWSYEHLFYRNGDANSGLATAIANQITNTDANISGILLSDMASANLGSSAQRSAEGTPVHF